MPETPAPSRSGPDPTFGLLGPVIVRGATGRTAELGGSRPRLVLAVLGRDVSRVVAVDDLVDALWGASLPKDPAGALQTHVSRLRHALDGVGFGDAVERSAAGYRLAVDRPLVDTERFADLVDRARGALHTDPDTARELAERALALWRGTPFGELGHNVALAGTTRWLTERRLDALELLADARVRGGDPDGAVATATGVLRDAPDRERALELVLRASYQAGRSEDALREYRAYRERLAERGLEPSPVLQELESAILRHDLDRPSPPTGSPPAVHLPASSFVGREQELVAVTDQLLAARMVTLVGTGGVGKTRLARHIAHHASSAFPGGTVFVDLAAVSDPAEVIPVVAERLGLHERRDTPMEDRVVAYLGPTRTLVVLDNCEHVLPTVAPLVERVVRETGSAVLCTSRQPLAADGEHVWTVEPLATGTDDPATELFLDRVQALRPTLDREACRSVASHIVGAVDGLPLAVELAASRARTLSLDDIADGLVARPVDLAGNRRGGTDRHGSLRTAIRWSYDLLSSVDADVFDRVCRFVGDFDLEAARDVAGPAVERVRDVDDIVCSLADRSLLVADPSGDASRFGLLEPLRHFGLDRLEERGLREETSARHAELFVGRAVAAQRASGGPGEVDWVRRLDRDLADLRSAHRWLVQRGAVDELVRLSASLHWFGWPGMRSEVTGWAIATVDAVAATEHPLLPVVYGAAAVGTWQRGDLDGAHHLAETGRSMVPADDPRAAVPQQALGDVALLQGRLSDAVVHYDAAVRAAVAAGDEAQVATDEANAAMALAYAGDVESGLTRARRAVALAAELGSPSVLAWTKYAHGEVIALVAPPEAVAHLQEAIDHAETVGARFVSGVAGLTALTVEARHGDPHRAVTRYPGLLDHWRRAGAWVQLWATLRTLIEVLVGIGADEPAMVLHGAAQAAPTAGALYGEEAERLAAAEAIVNDRTSPALVEDWIDRGRGCTGDEAAVYAIRCLEELVGDPPAERP